MLMVKWFFLLKDATQNTQSTLQFIDLMLTLEKQHDDFASDISEFAAGGDDLWFLGALNIPPLCLWRPPPAKFENLRLEWRTMG